MTSIDMRRDPNFIRGGFPCEGEFEIPIIRREELPQGPIDLVACSRTRPTDTEENRRKGVHFFVDDYQFERVWNNPDAYIDKLKQYACVLAPDFSPYGDMPLATQIFNHYRKHWVAAYWQAQGITVIPTIRCSTDDRSLEWYLDGEPKHSIVAYSSMWVRKDKSGVWDSAEKEFKTMMETLKPSKVLV